MREVGLRGRDQARPRAAPSPRRGLLDELLITLATRLWTVWKDWLARRSLVARRRRPSADDELHRDLRVSRISRRMSGAEDRERLDLVDRLDRGRAALVVEHRQLAEDVARPEGGQRDLAPVGVLADGACVAVADHVTRVGSSPSRKMTSPAPKRRGRRPRRRAARSSGGPASRTPAPAEQLARR